MYKFIIISLLASASFSLTHSNDEVCGIVLDQSYSEPLIGASVIVENTTNGTITGLDGRFCLKNVPKGATLKITYTGYSTISYQVKNNEKEITIILNEGMELDEVVVTAINTKRQSVLNQNQHAKTIDGVGPPTLPNQMIASPLHSVNEIQSCFPNTQHNTEDYAFINENIFKNPANTPLSTFSIDVDRASYSNIRRFINNGSLPPKDAVRIEEMINYFEYNYKEPEGDVPFAVHTSVVSCPWNKNNKILHIALQGRKFDDADLPASNLVFLIDVSGSMNSYNKLPLVKSSLQMLVNRLRPNDHVSIVVYAGSSGLVLPSTAGSDKNKIIHAINKLESGGSTAGGEGLKLAYKTARQHFLEEGNNRIILATDGDFNVGLSSDSEMTRLIEKERKSGIFISVLGYGMGNYKDNKMELIADKGNGNYAYIDNIKEAQKTLVREFGSTLFTIAKDVKIQIEFNPVNVAEYRLIGYENRLLNKEDFNDDKKDAGELGAGHTVTALYEIVPSHSESNLTSSVNALKYQKKKRSTNKYKSELATINLRYKDPSHSASKRIIKTVHNIQTEYQTSSSKEDIWFALAVAEFGLSLRESELAPNATIKNAINNASHNLGTDSSGDRTECLLLMKAVQELHFSPHLSSE